MIPGPIPEGLLRPQRPVRLDELEEDLDDYGEYVRAEGETGERKEGHNAGEPWIKGQPCPPSRRTQREATGLRLRA